MPEPGRGRASRNLRPRPWGVGRVGTCVRGPERSGESELASEALRVVVSMFFCVLYCSDLGIPYYGTQQVLPLIFFQYGNGLLF